MRHPTVISAAVILLATACSESNEADVAPDTEPDDALGAPTTTPPTPDPGDAGGTPGPVIDEDMAYYFKRGERGPTLSFGVPNTDNIALSLRCPSGATGESVLVYFNRPADLVARRPDTLTLTAGEADQRLAIETRSTQLGTTVEVQTSPDSAPMQAYRQGRTLEVRYGDETIAIPSRGEDETIQQFFDACVP